MAEKKGQIIVIKKIIVAGGGHHGGSWKVALADFMTAMMAFFLVMWLLGQSDETKKAVSDYFSTPSVIEYNFQNFGVEITLEKLFLDLLNEPLKAFQSFLEPVDKTPNTLDFGSAKMVESFLKDQLKDDAAKLDVSADGFEFEIEDSRLFLRGTSELAPGFVKIMDKISGITTGLADANIMIQSGVVKESLETPSDVGAQKVAAKRLKIIKNRIQAGLEFNTVDVKGGISVESRPGESNPEKLTGLIRISVKQKEVTSSGKAPRKLDMIFDSPNSDMSVYDNFVNQISNAKPAGKRFGRDENLKNPVDEEMAHQKPLPEGEAEE